MIIDQRDMQRIQNLVGDVSAENLKYVDCYIADHMGIFIPSVGFCEYAIRPQHTHPAYSFILSFTPEQSFVPVEIDVPAEHYLLVALSPEVPHEEEQTDLFKRYVAIMVEKTYFESSFAVYSLVPPAAFVWKQAAVKQEIMFFIKQFISEYEDQSPGFENILAALAEMITHQLIRALLAVQQPSSSISKRFEVQNVIDYMHQHFGEKITVKQLASLANMSESNFIRVFKQETSLTPMEFLIELRLQKAKKLLRSQKNITEAALLCGFNSPSHFSTCFSKHLGLSPTMYQLAFKELAD